MNEYSISYVVPTLNSSATLDAALLSLVSQREAEIKTIVADSGSSDGTLDICRSRNIPVIYAEPGNMYRALNAGLRECRTEWLAWLNSDDWMYPDALKRLLEHGNRTQADVVYGNCDFADESGRFVYSLSAARPQQLMPLFRCTVMGFVPHAAIFRRAIYEQHHGFDESYAFSSDADFFLRLLNSGARFVSVSGPPVACFRLHSNQLTQTHAAEMNAERARIYGAKAMTSDWKDQFVLWHWQTRNLPHYLLRIIRESLLSQRLRFPRSMENYQHH